MEEKKYTRKNLLEASINFAKWYNNLSPRYKEDYDEVRLFEMFEEETPDVWNYDS